MDSVTSKEHVCRYLELQPDGSYFCGGCQKTLRLAHEPPVAPSAEYKIGDRVNHDGHITEIVGLSIKYMLCGGAVVYGHDLQPALTKGAAQCDGSGG